jgi:hypothetical protein
MVGVTAASCAPAGLEAEKLATAQRRGHNPLSDRADARHRGRDREPRRSIGWLAGTIPGRVAGVRDGACGVGCHRALVHPPGKATAVA